MGFFDIPNGGGWFSKRSRAERAELAKYKKPKISGKAKRSIHEAAERDREIERLRTKTDVLRDKERLQKAKAEYERKKKATRKPYTWEYLQDIHIKKKKQGRPLSRKRRITLL